MTIRTAIRTFFAALLAAVAAACSDDCREMPGGAGDVYLSFAVRMERTGMPSTRGGGNSEPVADGEVTERTDAGTPEERAIHNLWVLLYSDDTDDAASELKYCFDFETNGAGGFDSPGGTIGPKAGGNANEMIYETSAKRIEPGVYRLVAVANSKVQENNAGKTLRDKIAELRQSGKLSTYKGLKEGSNGVTLRMPVPANTDAPGGYVPRDDRADKIAGVTGLFAVHTDNRFRVTASAGTSAADPLRKAMGLTRGLAKVVVNFTNCDKDGNMYPNSAGYRLKSAEVVNFAGAGRLFEWNTFSPETDGGWKSQKTIDYENGYERGTQTWKVTETCKEAGNGIAPGKALPLQTLFTQYMFAVKSGDATDLQTKEGNHVYIRIVMARQKNGRDVPNTDLEYHIPVYNRPGAARPGYLETGQYTDYTTVRNTLYELNLRFNGKCILETGIDVSVKEFRPVNAVIPPFE